MNELIPIVNRAIGADVIQTVSARELHKFLKVQWAFPHWIKDRIGKYGFTADVDFCVFEDLSLRNSASSKSRDQRTIEYALTLDMAKELAMVERNEKGKQARVYFIECERRLKAVVKPVIQIDFNDPVQLRSLLNGSIETTLKLQTQVAEMLPDVKAFDRIAKANGLYNFRDTANALGMRQTDCIKKLEFELKWVYRGQSDRKLRAYSETIRKGWMDEKVATVERDGVDKTYVQAMVTPKGLTVLAKKLGVELQSMA